MNSPVTLSINTSTNAYNAAQVPLPASPVAVNNFPSGPVPLDVQGVLVLAKCSSETARQNIRQAITCVQDAIKSLEFAIEANQEVSDNLKSIKYPDHEYRLYHATENHSESVGDLEETLVGLRKSLKELGFDEDCASSNIDSIVEIEERAQYNTWFLDDRDYQTGFYIPHKPGYRECKGICHFEQNKYIFDPNCKKCSDHQGVIVTPDVSGPVFHP